MRQFKNFAKLGTWAAALVCACVSATAFGQSLDQLQGGSPQPKPPQAAESKGDIVGKWQVEFSDGKGGNNRQTLTFTADGKYHVIDVDAAGKTTLENTGTFTFQNGEMNITFSGGQTVAWTVTFPTADRFTNKVIRCSWSQDVIGLSATFDRVKGKPGIDAGVPAKQGDVLGFWMGIDSAMNSFVYVFKADGGYLLCGRGAGKLLILETGKYRNDNGQLHMTPDGAQEFAAAFKWSNANQFEDLLSLVSKDGAKYNHQITYSRIKPMAAITGTWNQEMTAQGANKYSLQLKADGTVDINVVDSNGKVVGTSSGKYTYANDLVTIQFPNGETLEIAIGWINSNQFLAVVVNSKAKQDIGAGLLFANK